LSCVGVDPVEKFLSAPKTLRLHKVGGIFWSCEWLLA